MFITWRKKEFLEFITFKKWAFKRRRVQEIPAYLYPIGFGFSIARRIREGFWRDPATGMIYVGFLESSSNFHYAIANRLERSSADYPEPALIPLSFREGYCALIKQMQSPPDKESEEE